ncbi:AAA family ATPase [Phyllobacterium sp. YR531]|uniref:ATP-dependent nuclease n=1 Tax=Phyllobacterium sp. YR531 TaxID=1144343 RepID=UPI00026F75DF|nr:AAA family ATPase [Phyllobacterium sp. YR531]EJM99568.1 hypothetical protein PMI41_04027 [Phyllobacterium sp. YR531]
MRIVKFDIRNFKGIAHTSIDLSNGTPGNVTTLVGLNESGKTTILEALSHFVTEDKITANLVETVYKKTSLQNIIPKEQKSAFTGHIKIEATVEIDDSDIEALAEEFLSKEGFIIDKDAIPRKFAVTRDYEFQDSSFKDSSKLWRIKFLLKKKGNKKYKSFGGFVTDEKNDVEIWRVGIQFLGERIPKIIYFPTFLFDFPDRIYIENSGETNEEKTSAYYTQVIQDVLDSQGKDLTIQKHIIDRINRSKEHHSVAATFMPYLFGRDEKKQIDAVLQQASTEMSRVIFGSWNQILGRNVTGKRVQIDWLLDTERNNAPYLEVSIIDGQSKYSLSECSLGFRWFFSFLLFTQFRRNRKDGGATIFLFDEPAANLHSKAQIKLLESFAGIAGGSVQVIYSTHSHYMINPTWLERAYIVENKATNYENEDQIDMVMKRETDIKAVKYKTFVGSYPTKTTYFQPVLDALDIPFSPLIRSARALIIEGKFDYHPFVYLRRDLSCSQDSPEMFPANGAGSIGSLISLFRGWGVEFRIILDDDNAGREGKKRYIEEYLLTENQVVTLGDISSGLRGKSFEAVYKDDVKEAVRRMFGVKTIQKKHYSLLFQQLLNEKNNADLNQTKESFREISNWIDSEFGVLS